MKAHAAADKALRHSRVRFEQGSPAAVTAAVLAPPAYGIEFVDTGLAAAAPVQRLRDPEANDRKALQAKVDAAPGLPYAISSPAPMDIGTETQARGHNGCGCASCRFPGTGKLPPIQRVNSDSDYQTDDDEPPCDDTQYHDDDCDLKHPYSGNVRTYFYPSNYWGATITWKNTQLTALQDPHNAGNFVCPRCNVSKLKSTATIDHLTSVASHWNTVGYNIGQAGRTNWYNDTTNMGILCGPCNSSVGSGGVYYRQDVDSDFTA